MDSAVGFEDVEEEEETQELGGWNLRFEVC